MNQVLSVELTDSWVKPVEGPCHYIMWHFRSVLWVIGGYFISILNYSMREDEQQNVRRQTGHRYQSQATDFSRLSWEFPQQHSHQLTHKQVTTFPLNFEGWCSPFYSYYFIQTFYIPPHCGLWAKRFVHPWPMTWVM